MYTGEGSRDWGGVGGGIDSKNPTSLSLTSPDSMREVESHSTLNSLTFHPNCCTMLSIKTSQNTTRTLQEYTV